MQAHDGQDLVAVDETALFVHDQEAIAIAVKGKAQICPNFLVRVWIFRDM